MKPSAILVNWRYAKEVIAIDLQALRRGEQIKRTTETWPGCERPYVYHTTSAFDPSPKGGGRLTIHYSLSKNRHMEGLGCRWGYSQIHLDAKLSGGNAEWHDDEEADLQVQRRHYSGIRLWKPFSKESIDLTTRERELVERVSRKQAMFRKRLLMIDPRCAITGEAEPALLDAAHVAPVKANGADIESNGLLLRIDLHRLFDRGFFDISSTGIVQAKKKLKSAYYLDLLKKARLDEPTFRRIRLALK